MHIGKNLLPVWNALKARSTALGCNKKVSACASRKAHLPWIDRLDISALQSLRPLSASCSWNPAKYLSTHRFSLLHQCYWCLANNKTRSSHVPITWHHWLAKVLQRMQLEAYTRHLCKSLLYKPLKFVLHFLLSKIGPPGKMEPLYVTLSLVQLGLRLSQPLNWCLNPKYICHGNSFHFFQTDCKNLVCLASVYIYIFF